MKLSNDVLSERSKNLAVLSALDESRYDLLVSLSGVEVLLSLELELSSLELPSSGFILVARELFRP